MTLGTGQKSITHRVNRGKKRFHGGSKWGRRGCPVKRIIKTISVVSKTLHKKQKAIEKQYDNLVEAANRLALTVESDHNIIADSHEYIHRNRVFHIQTKNGFLNQKRTFSTARF